MCFSFESSIISYVLGITVSALLLQSKNYSDKHIALFSLTFVQMQLAEALMWYDINCKSNLNHYGSILAHFILILQPLSIFIGAYYFNTTIIPKNILQILIILYSFPLLMAMYHHFIKKTVKLCSLNTKKNKGELLWDFNIRKDWWFYQIYSIIQPASILLIWLLFSKFSKENWQTYTTIF